MIKELFKCPNMTTQKAPHLNAQSVTIFLSLKIDQLHILILMMHTSNEFVIHANNTCSSIFEFSKRNWQHHQVHWRPKKLIQYNLF
jgi:hypothetical protein